MQIKGMDGTSYNVASSGTGNTALGLGIAGTALGLLNGGGFGNILGGWGNGNGNGCCSENTMVNRYELNQAREADSLKSENALLRAQVYTDQKLVDVVNDYTSKINALGAEVRANKDEQYAINLQQATLNATQTATISAISAQIAQLQSLSQLVVPQNKVCDTCCCNGCAQ